MGNTTKFLKNIENMGLPGFGPEFPTPEAGRIPGYPTDPLIPDSVKPCFKFTVFKPDQVRAEIIFAPKVFYKVHICFTYGKNLPQLWHQK